MPEPRCEKMKQNGERCRAKALPGKAFCFHHDPDSAGQRRAARVAGGRARALPRTTLPPGTPDVELKTVADMVGLLGETINQVRTGRLDVKVGSCVGFLAGHLLATLKVGPLEERIAALEARQNGGQR